MLNLNFKAYIYVLININYYYLYACKIIWEIVADKTKEIL